MKFAFSLLTVILLFITIGCNKPIVESATKTEQPAQVAGSLELSDSEFVIGKLQGRRTVFATSEDEIQKLFSQQFPEITNSNNFDFLSFNERVHYVRGSIQTAKGMGKAVIELIPTPRGLSYIKGKSSQASCLSTDGCEQCTFLPSATGQVDGCNCTSREGDDSRGSCLFQQ